MTLVLFAISCLCAHFFSEGDVTFIYWEQKTGLKGTYDWNSKEMGGEGV